MAAPGRIFLPAAETLQTLSERVLSCAPMSPRRREAWTLLAAVSLHVVAIAFVRSSLDGAPTLRLTDATVRAPADVEWEIELGATAQGVSPSPESAPARVGQEAERLAARPRVPELARDVTATATEEAVDAAPTEIEDTSPHVPEANASARPPIDLGIGSDAWQRWVRPPNEQPPSTREPARVRSNRFQVFRAPPASTTGGVQEGLEKRDRELGLGPSGPVISALHHTAHESITPAVGKATFEVTVLGTGAVQVTLGSVSGQPDEWKKVAVRIAERLRAAPPRIPPPRKGARFVVELVAEETMPNGTKISSLKGPHLDASPLRLRSTEDEKRQLELDNPTAKNDADDTPAPPIQLDLPGVYLAERGKVCSYRLGIGVFGPVFQGGCDPSQIGAKPQRMVHARVLEESLF